MDALKETTPEILKKKKGRPRKYPLPVANVEDIPCVVDGESEPEKKKRGRKKKEKVEEEVKPKKKRGRKAAVKYFSSSIRRKIPLTTVIQDNDKSILHLDIKDIENKCLAQEITYGALKTEYSGAETFGELDNTKFSSTINDNDVLNEYIESSMEKTSDIVNLYEERLETRMQQDTKLVERLENLHMDDELLNNLLNTVNEKSEIKCESTMNKMDNRQKGFFNVLDEFVGNKEWLQSTDVCCWWCCHSFETVPIGLPLDYNVKTKKFKVKGVFCSFSCMMAYGEREMKGVSFRTNVDFLYQKLTGTFTLDKTLYGQQLERSLPIDIFGEDLEDAKRLKDGYIEALLDLQGAKLTPAPPRCSLKMFGGALSIEEFRKSSKENKVYKMIEFPMTIYRDFIEEVDIENVKSINMNVFGKTQKIFQENIVNILDEKRVADAKQRVNTKNNVVTSNSIDKFITF